MTVKCSDIASFIEGIAPAHLAEDWDNVGLLVGTRGQEIKRVMVCLDVTSGVADEAVEKKADLIVSHHPIIFKGMKRVTQDDAKGRLIYKLIQNNIGVYSAHTNLDVAEGGINDRLAELLGLVNVRNLNKYRAERLYKIVVFVPEESVGAVRDAMSGAGAGWIGNYSDCSFMAKGTGTFRPLEGTNPYIGSLGVLERVDEYRLETVIGEQKLRSVLDAMIKAHPYEEVAYDVYAMERNGREYGLGKIGLLETPQKLEDFILTVKNSLGLPNVRLIGELNREVKKVAVFCGSFDDNWSGVLREKADVLVTGELKYHTAQDAMEMGICVIEAGHFGTERIIVPVMAGLLAGQFPGIEVICNSVEKNPFKIT